MIPLSYLLDAGVPISGCFLNDCHFDQIVTESQGSSSDLHLCVCSFSCSYDKYHGKSHLREKGLILAYSSREVHHGQESIAFYRSIDSSVSECLCDC